jgi:hypothetical protein
MKICMARDSYRRAIPPSWGKTSTFCWLICFFTLFIFRFFSQARNEFSEYSEPAYKSGVVDSPFCQSTHRILDIEADQGTHPDIYDQG